MMSEVMQFLYFNQNHSKIDIVLIFFQMGTIEHHFEQGKYFCSILVLDMYTPLMKKKFVCSNTHSMFSKRKMFQNRPFYTKIGREKLTLWCCGIWIKRKLIK